MNNLRIRKINRIKAGHPIKVLDLFAGCGGLSLGFHSAGFDIVGAIEIDAVAAKSHALNFFKAAPDNIRALHSMPQDITAVEPDELIAKLKMGGEVQNTVDMIIGGPPCQAFARVGRAKLREVMDHPEAFKKDPRAVLYTKYLEYVRQLQPVALLMENVPDILNFGGHNVAEEVCEVLSELGYICRYTLLNSAYYGVPQMRERLFLLAFAKEFGKQPDFPTPTHWMDLPKGYAGTRQVALKSLEQGLFGKDSHYIEPPKPHPGLLPAVTAMDALCDLPNITGHLSGNMRKMPQRLDKLVPYPQNKPISEYGKLMRQWPGFENQQGIKDHVIRYLPRDYAIFRRMKGGDQYPEAYRVAMEMFYERIHELEQTGVKITPDSDQYENLKKEIVPPYDPGKFPNKWRKMEAGSPARTLMAHLGKDGYSHIHYDSEQARTISVREAARLQSFPDGFVFAGSMNAAFRQIGNAVPPLMARALAREIHKTIGGYLGDEEACCQATYRI